MTERIIELVAAGYKIKFGSGPFQTKHSLRITISKDGNSVKRMIFFDELKASCLPAETIILCHINKMLDELVVSSDIWKEEGDV